MTATPRRPSPRRACSERYLEKADQSQQHECNDRSGSQGLNLKPFAIRDRCDTGGVPGHSHHHHPIVVPVRTQRLLALALTPFLVATIVGLILLWPTGDADLGQRGFDASEVRASVIDVARKECADVPGQENFTCSEVTIRIEEGADSGESFTFEFTSGPKVRSIRTGDAVIVGTAPQPQAEGPPGAPPPPKYFFLDFDRRVPLLALAIVFAVVVMALSRWRGLAALAGLGVSLLVLVRFVLPAILEGSSPLPVAIVGGSTIMFLALYLAHGINAATTTAVLGTLASLFLTGLLALFFVDISVFTGAGSEEAAFLQISQQQVDLQGLLLASIIIGTLGVLDDVTVTQAAAVWELRRADPTYRVRELYRSAIRIGRDHIASTVNTLVLAYAGASLPLLILFSVSTRPLVQILNTETVAEEIVRTLVGSVGLVASVPITTALAALVVTSVHREGNDDEAGSASSPDRPTSDDDEFRIPRRERDFWDET